jgi:hypothetical protein
MRTLRVFDLNMGSLIFRYYLMMGVVAVLGFLGLWTLAAVAGYALAISCILGASFGEATEETAAKAEPRIHRKMTKTTLQKAA